jgi:hypothetical protein
VVAGAILGGLMLAWTVVGAVLAVALIALSLMDANRNDATPRSA